ncbi:unnamed protein product [Adineta steineri]|uniref:Beta-lactamase-related domain-containing protein n=1 Tax=Adineta steineri TaxID=433720 RepID=A0A815IRK3_9BILA|nr:unnamed protein product [Adineta steineri]
MSSTANNNNVHGIVAPTWENVRAVFEQNIIDGLDLGASLCVYHQGQCVVDLSGGWKDVEKTKPYTPETLQIVYSTSKGVMAAAVALCVDKGWLDYDAPVAKYITFKGSFGSETIIFQKTIANEFEERLSEMIHQRSIQCFTRRNEHNESLLLSEPLAPMISRNIVDIEMETEKKYAYQPLPSVA